MRFALFFLKLRTAALSYGQYIALYCCLAEHIFTAIFTAVDLQ